MCIDELEDWRMAGEMRRSRQMQAEARSHAENHSFPEHVATIQRQIAREMGAGFLRCDRCKREQNLSVEQTEEYLRNGFPKCCEGLPDGGTMSYHRKEER